MGGLGSGRKGKIQKRDYPRLLSLFHQTENQAQVAREFKVSREAVRQKLLLFGITSKSLRQQKKEIIKQLLPKWSSLPTNQNFTPNGFYEFCYLNGLRLSLRLIREVIKETAGSMTALRLRRLVNLVKKYGVQKTAEKLNIPAHNIYNQFHYHKVSCRQRG